jgi:predicted nucleotidyltransferase
MNDGLTPKNREEIRAILAKSAHVERAVLFGSRATGTFGRASDIDLALEGDDLELTDLLSLHGKFSESSLPYEVDLVIRANIADPELESRIQRHGTMFYEQ